ncbi:hypothetical protein REPUB_Repub08aG0052000 [Reevesia pubescens]
MNQVVFEVGRSGTGSIKPLIKKEYWDAKNIMDDKKLREQLPPKIPLRQKNKTKLAKLPNSPDCPSFIAWYLDTNYELTAIPPLFFHRILLLQVLDLSNSNIKSLPKSLPKLVALKKLCLRQCKLFMELSPQIGKLKNLEELDLDETQIVDLPAEIGQLVRLRKLRVSFYGLTKFIKKRLQANIVIRPETISNLSQLIELSIDVDPADKRWDDSMEAVVKEVCRLKVLTSLSLYLPKVQVLDDFSSNLMYPSLSKFRFIVGYQKRRIISRVPDEVEAEFRNWGKCLKFVNGENIPIGIKRVLNYSTSFYLDNHATAVNLSEFGIENMKRIKFCLLAECNKMETIIDQSEVHQSSAKHVLESLQYLSIYYMKNLGSIWKGPVQYGCFSKLKSLALRTCPKLSTVFPHDLIENFVNLEEFILEDCPRVTNLISYAPISFRAMSDNFLPSLKRLLLLYLPELVNISNGLLIAPKLESIGFYSCPKFKCISKLELSSKNLKKIKGESEWWADIKWNETEWGTEADYLMRVFSPISKDRDVMTQLVEDQDIFVASIKTEEQPGKVMMTKSEPQYRIPNPDPIDGNCSPYNKTGTWQQPELFASDKSKNRNRKDNGKRRLRERLRRQEMKSLIDSLISLLPPVTKGKCTIPDTLERARSYIELQRKRIDELRGLRDDQLKKFSSGFDLKLTSSKDYFSSCVVVRSYGIGGIEVALRSGLEGRGFPLSRVLQLLLDEGLDVVSCISSTLDGRWIHTIQSEVNDHDLTSVDISLLQQKLAAEVSYLV